MYQIIIPTVTSIIFAVLYCLFFYKRYGFLIADSDNLEKLKIEEKEPKLNKKKRKRLQQDIRSLELAISKKSTENYKKAKREVMLVWCYFSVMLINIFYLLLKKSFVIDIKDNFNDSFDIYSLFIALLMICSSLVMWLLIKDKNQRRSGVQLYVTEEVARQMTCSYVVAIFAVIGNLVIIGRYGAAYAWFLILIGKFLWFDSYRIFKMDFRVFFSKFKDMEFTIIALLSVGLYSLTAVGLAHNLNVLSLTMMTLGITLFTIGLITVGFSIYHIKKKI